MAELELWSRARREGFRVVGAYLYPFRLFGDKEFENPYWPAQVVRSVSIESYTVLITRNGGVFVQPPDTFSEPLGANPSRMEDIVADIPEKLQFERALAGIFNRLICELALLGIVSEPISPVYVFRGDLLDAHIFVSGGGGGRDSYVVDRAMAPLLAIHQREWFTRESHPESVLDQAASQLCTTRLAALSEALPGLIAGAYSLASRQQLSEALIDSWVVIEQIQDAYWQSYVSGLSRGDRRQRLADTRTYTAGVRTEVLLIAGVFDEVTYDLINKARKHRNDTAHRARISVEACSDSLRAMHALVELVCGRSVEPPLIEQSVSW